MAPAAWPYLLLYGSADGDVDGATNPAVMPFRHYDRALTDKFAVRIVGGNHNHFNDSWSYSDATRRLVAPSDDPSSWDVTARASPVNAVLIDAPTQRRIGAAYVSAFLSVYAEHDLAARAFLLGPAASFRPVGLDPKVELQQQARLASAGPVVIDDYESNWSPAVSSSGQPVTYSTTLVSDAFLQDLSLADETEPWNRFFQDTRGALFSWTAPSEYVETLGPAGDLSSKRTLSFRVALQPKDATTALDPSARTAAVELEDADGNKSSISLRAIDTISAITSAQLDDIPPTDITSAAFKTFRVPIAGFIADGRKLDLTRVTKLRFKWGAPESPAGRVAVDDVEIEP